MKKPLTEQDFEKIYSKVPRLCVDLVVKAPNGIVLSLRSLKTWNNQWHLPGGTVYYKETIEQAVARVARNELGISVKFIKPIGYIEYPSEEKERGFGWAISIVVLCTANELEFTVNEEATKIETFHKLPESTIFEQAEFLTIHWGEIAE